DPHLERRARRPWRERDGGRVLPDEPVPGAGLLAHEAAPRAFALADDEARGAAELLPDAVRDQGQVVQVQAQVVRSGARLGAPVLDDLQVVRLPERRRVA